MEIQELPLSGLLLLRTPLFEDDRGSFSETYRQEVFSSRVLPETHFVQDNESRSKRAVFRGLHYQLPPAAQAKLVRVVFGSILDVVVDIRADSPSFGKSEIVELSDRNRLALFVPPGFAHGFLSLEDNTLVQYKTSSYYNPKAERSIHHSCVSHDWPIPREAWIVSSKDQVASSLDEADLF
jgi:dTDP-4-dehydrorhamnose 3,5-epimerase